ncbi:hypothetical protein [Escherichia coli]|uniref:hypothetical protein n=1 Tax=Escherichia coli TaxID=562 RepID=UPI00227076D7|nr:hypothetical protein [Escherichia coli]MCX9332075.1 hypothetical protein [Escherichia coli]MCX9341070.1 hypothetical protein [Escherichia coli]MCX9345599.1 hypothetical protein [Escherichia coli]MCX9354389.1 hypothetical protein [Escherichia coli]MCX9358953.1 hypothetical protein [Escherichia coli]
MKNKIIMELQAPFLLFAFTLSVLTNNSGINERWQTSLIQHQKLKNYSATQQ